MQATAALGQVLDGRVAPDLDATITEIDAVTGQVDRSFSQAAVISLDDCCVLSTAAG